MFSKRLPADFTENALSIRAQEARLSSTRFLDLTESNPTRVGLLAPDSLIERLGHRSGAHYAPDPRGLRSARTAVSRDYRTRGVDVDPDHIVLTASSSESYSLLFKLLADPGDEVLVPAPSYPLFEFLAELDGVRVRSYPLLFDDEWHLSIDSLRRLVTDRTRAIVVVHPNNPTGSFIKKEEATALDRFCAERGLAIIADEVFADFPFAADEHRFETFASPSKALAFVLGGLSKSCALPQLKLGWIAVSGPEGPRRDALHRLEFIADTYLSVATPVQMALPHILEHKETLQAPVKRRLKQNLAALASSVADHNVLTLLRPEGGWSALIQCPATRSDEERALLALNSGVLVHPGHFFDVESGCTLVVSLLCEPEIFDEALPDLMAAATR